MCGIAGWVGRTDFNSAETIAKVKKCMLSRGPDLQKDKAWENVTLIHNRLKIIDLSELGDQPMCNEDGTIWVVFNGEIYNHRALQADLEKKGHKFRSKSDTEVILHLYEEEGIDFVKHLKGMFAIGLYDTNKQKVILARDRFGIKPLFFYNKDDRNLIFSSTLNAIKSVPGIDLSINRQAIFDFTSLFYVPAPYTFYTHITALLPGETLEINISTDRLDITKKRFHTHLPVPDKGLSAEDMVERSEALIENAVNSQLESDVKLGSLLSGGIDSSLVSYYAQKNLNSKLHTYNVKFAEEEYDETWAAVAVAESIGSRHETLLMENGSAGWDKVTSLLLHTGQPFADTSYFAAHGVCALMKKHVTVALSGDGGDEAFGGYTPFGEIEQIFRFNNIPRIFTGPAVLAARMLAPANPKFARFDRIFRAFYNKDEVEIVENFYRWIRKDEHEQLMFNTSTYDEIRRFIEPNYEALKPQGLRGLELLSALLSNTYAHLTLPNDFLFKVDAASMYESLEVRVPMLDEDLFENGLTLPHNLKVNNKELKHILRRIARKRLPDKVANKPKWGFGIPVDTWVNKEFKERANSYLSNHAILKETLNETVYKEWVDCFCNNKPHRSISREGIYQRVIMLLALALHLD